MNYKSKRIRKRTLLCWSIAGFDGGGDAGVLADLETFARLGVRGRAVVTAVTAQSPAGVRHLQPVSAENLCRQLDCLLEQGEPQAIKIGVLARAELVKTLADWLEANLSPSIPRVLDPVLEASAGGSLLEKSALAVLRHRLIPLITVISPNLAEAYALVGQRKTKESRTTLARKLLELGCSAVVITGGDARGPVKDVLATKDSVQVFTYARLPVKAHGTGCRFSSALAVGLARGLPISVATQRASKLVRSYLFGLLQSKMRNQ